MRIGCCTGQKLEGRQHALKQALFAAYFTDGRNPSDRDVLIDVAQQAGLDPLRAREILESGLYTDDVREREQLYGRAGYPRRAFCHRQR